MTLEPRWLLVARTKLDLAEIPGSKSNPEILEFLSSINLPEEAKKHDEISWCAAFVNWCLKQAGCHGTDSPAARSYLKWGVPLTQPITGCIAIYKRGQQSWQGHVGFFLGKPLPGYDRILGGNQKNKVSLMNFSIKNLLGYRWPKD